MFAFARTLAAVALAVLLAQSAPSQSPAPSTAATTITVPDLDCPVCAKKVGTKVGEVTGVAKVEFSVEAKFIKVTPKAGAAVSPKALWEAVEKGGKNPSKIEGPAGTYSSKPAN